MYVCMFVYTRTRARITHVYNADTPMHTHTQPHTHVEIQDPCICLTLQDKRCAGNEMVSSAFETSTFCQTHMRCAGQ
jgi:hypothetical protein